jgi:8-hydroxy-5-deazaflavin:NADPH oxidoreductase
MTTLGFVGLGHMGGTMAARFLAAGYTVYGESRDPRDAQDLAHEGLPQSRSRWCSEAGGHGSTGA